MATQSFLRLPEFKTEKEIDGLIKALENDRKPQLTGAKAEPMTEEQIKIFNKHRKEQKIIMYQLLNALKCLDKGMVKEELKEYEFIK